MQELDRRVGMLRLLLADLTARRQQTEDALKQQQAQITRLVDYTVRQNGAVGNALAALADLDERLRRAEGSLRHIELLRRRAQEELDALLVTRGVADARARVAELERRRDELLAEQDSVAQDELTTIEAELAELWATIAAASDAAARALTERQK